MSKIRRVDLLINSVLSSELKIETLPDFEKFKTPQEKGIWMLSALRVNEIAEKLSAKQIVEILRRKFGRKFKYSQSAMINSLDRVDKRILEVIFEGKRKFYKIKDYGLKKYGFSQITDVSKKAIFEDSFINSIPFLNSPIIENAKKMTDVYGIIYCFENSIRQFIATKLRGQYGENWWNKAASNDLKRKVNRRINQERENRWHSKRGAHEIYYTDIDDLIGMIKKEWAFFKDIIPTQSWIESRISDISLSRNIIAHNNILPSREINRLKMHIEDWIRQVS